jgi:hypothetical protein
MECCCELLDGIARATRALARNKQASILCQRTRLLAVRALALRRCQRRRLRKPNDTGERESKNGRERERETETKRESERHRETERDRQAGRERERGAREWESGERESEGARQTERLQRTGSPAVLKADFRQPAIASASACHRVRCTCVPAPPLPCHHAEIWPLWYCFRTPGWVTCGAHSLSVVKGSSTCCIPRYDVRRHRDHNHHHSHHRHNHHHHQ